MKKLLLITTMILCCGNMFSQEKEQNDIGLRVDKMIKNLDTSKITSGILLDRSANWSNLDHVNSYDRNKPINYAYFKQALLDLHIASNKEKFISSSTLKKSLKKENVPKDIVNVGIITASYETLNFNESDVTKSGLKLNNNRFELISGKPSFLSNSSLIISPLRIAAKGETITYKFSNEFWFNNSQKKIVSLVAEFGKNKTYEIIRNNKIVLNQVQQTYTKTGDKLIVFKANYNDGTQKTIESKVYIIANEISNNYSARVSNDFVISDETFNGQRGRMDYRIYYRTTNGSNPSLKKPIIIIDGFDPGDKRRITDADCANDPDCVDKFDGYFSNDEHISIWDFNFYKDSNGVTKNLITELRARGYDVVIVNNPTHQISGQPEIDGGADYIERNGKTLVTLIKRLNTQIGNSRDPEELVIVGPSMGGLISRYALAYMEKRYNETNNRNWLHNTRLWISVDSPHLGANIPIGLQASIHQLAGIDREGAIEFRDNQLGSVAAKQQLIEQYNGRNGNQLDQTKLNARTVSQGYSYTRGSTFFRNFYNNLFNNGLPGSKGYPQNLRKISVTNGSLSNSKEYVTDFLSGLPTGSFSNNGQRTLNVRGFMDIPFTTHVLSIETYFKKHTGGNGKISRLKLGPSIGNLDQSLYLTNNNSRGNMDNVSGGWFAGQADLEKSIEREGLNFEGTQIGYIQTRELKPNHSFIATFSAIGHLSPDRSWNQTLDKNLVCQNFTPFDSYFGEDKNSRHTSFNAKNVEWLLAELGTNTDLPVSQDPYFPVNAANLVGSGTICRDNVRTYTFSTCSTPGSVSTWAVSSNLIKLSSTGNSVTVEAPADSRNSGWIRATFSNGVVVQKNLWVGKPKQPASITGPSVVYTGALVNYNAGVAPGATSYDWLLPYPFDVSNPIDYFADDWQMIPTPGRYLTAMTGYAKNAGLVQVRGENVCGVGGVKTINVSHHGTNNDDGNNDDGNNDGDGGDVVIGDTGGGGIPRMANNNNIKIYPNPTKDILNVEINEISPFEDVKIMLFDVQSRLIIDHNIKGNHFTINTAPIQDGSYILKIFTNKNSFTKKIIIKH